MDHHTHRKPEHGKLIFAEDEYYDFNNVYSGLNDNVLVVGGSGTGKTRGVVRPNILQAEGSYVICDPKGNLYDLYRDYLNDKGYRVERLDFVQPERSTVKYNFFQYIRNQTDILKVVHLLCSSTGRSVKDPFWDQSAQIILEGIVSLLIDFRPEGYRNFGMAMDLLRKGQRTDGGRSEDVSKLDYIFQSVTKGAENSFAARCYQSVAVNPARTWNCVISTILAKLAAYDTDEIRSFLSADTLDLPEMGSQKTAIFITVSDTDRSIDSLVNVFFTQAMQELCRVADRQPQNRLEIPVRFILDDFATNVLIDDFPRMISSIRSRGISAMILLQAEAQLRSGYHEDAATIISNCDSYIYLGGNDIETARAVGERCDQSMLDVLNMPVRTCWVFRRGQKARRSSVFDLDEFEKQCKRDVERQKEVNKQINFCNEREAEEWNLVS